VGKAVAEQIVAANIDIVFLVTSLNADLNLRRIERYISTIWESGADPVILLNKADLCNDPALAVSDVAHVMAGVPVHAISAVTSLGLQEIQRYLGTGITIALLGSSGVGKSTIVNRLIGLPAQKVREIREDDDRGRHATTSRKLFILPQGGILIDTPGMRELQLWDAQAGVEHTFEDVGEIAGGCRFRDCEHDREPGCAVREALQDGVLDADRFEGYLKLKKELEHLARRTDTVAQVEQKKRWKKIHKAHKQHYKLKREI
jgi:ribosome biogenesis GTPase